MKDLLKQVVLGLGCTFALNCYAWDAVGHTLVADIAYEELQPAVKAKVDEIVVSMHKEYPKINKFSDVASWPDTLHSQKIELFTHWHYIDQSFSDDGTPLKNVIDTDNVVWGIKGIIPVVKNAKANPYERARFLSFLVHFVGDIHQPLHTASRISAAHPDGDKGGNLFQIQFPAASHPSHSMHKWWDEGFGLWNSTFDDAKTSALAKEISLLYPRAYFAAKADDMVPEDWAKEGLELARTFVYTTPENQLPNYAYITSGKAIVQQRVALAGHRLANLLNTLLK